MNAEERNLALQNAVLEWQKKYGIRDGDPLLASLELFHIYLRVTHPSAGQQGSRLPAFEDFRATVELLDQRSKGFSKQAGELIQELRIGPDIRRRLRAYKASALLLIFIGALVSGLVIGKFLL